MAKKNTRHVKVGKYTLTSHAQNRIVDRKRDFDKTDVLNTLFFPPNGITETKYKDGNPSYSRVGRRVTAAINPTNNKVVPCIPISRQDKKQFDLLEINRKGRKKKIC
ncbi:MAG: hypothetical protein IJ735_04090 [Clostridia bacterium]|nr:hypothetical protein [Clostridia bacterium]